MPARIPLFTPEDQLKPLILATRAMQDYLANGDDADFYLLVHGVAKEIFGDYDPAISGSISNSIAFFNHKAAVIYEMLRQMGRLPPSLLRQEEATQANIEAYRRIKHRGFKGFMRAAEQHSEH